jgi:hypothetical protein
VQIEIACNNSPTKSTSLNTCQIVNEIHLWKVYKVWNLRKQEINNENGEEITIIMQELHAEIRQKIRHNKKEEFEDGDWYWHTCEGRSFKCT